jgi:hypothetical protein
MSAKAIISALERGAREMLRSRTHKAKPDLFARPGPIERNAADVLELTHDLKRESFTDGEARAFVLGLRLGVAAFGLGALRRQYGKILKGATLTANDLREAELKFGKRTEQARALGVSDRHLRRLRRQLLDD